MMLKIKPDNIKIFMDHLTPAERSWNMSRIHSKDTKPEVFVRSYLHRNGFRFRINNNNITGKPDIYLKKYNAVIFVHGCFWHRHKNCKRATMPKSNIDYWDLKFKKNKKRDKLIMKELQIEGYRVFVIWECQVNNKSVLYELTNSIRNIEEAVHNE
ncbi:DNA mismatch endonuclease Vsr [uncultured archaeon]|nr:DNA mismatch endonuclease Vsr [uncultured archaeon]